MEQFGGLPGVIAQINLLQDIEHLQRRVTLTIRRQFVDVITMIMNAAGLHPFAPMCGQILEAHIGTNTPEVSVHRLRKRTLVESRAAVPTDNLQRIGKIQIA